MPANRPNRSHPDPRRPSIPTLLLIPAGLGLALFALPLLGLAARTPWRDLITLLRAEPVLDAVRLSLISSFGSVLIALVLGIPLAWILSRIPFPGRSVVRGLVLLPMVLPPVVGGAALLFALGRRGLVGAPLYEATGLVLPYTTVGVILAGVFVSMPLMVLTVEGGFRSLDGRYEQAAETLGAKGWTVLTRVSLPLITPAILAGSALTWARALGEFGATLTFAGNLAGRTQTLPLAVFVALESDREAALAISLVMVVISLAVLISLRGHWWQNR